MRTKRALEARPSLAARDELRHNWACAEVEAIYRTPRLEQMLRAHTVHRTYGTQTEVCATNHIVDRAQTRRLISIGAAGA